MMLADPAVRVRAPCDSKYATMSRAATPAPMIKAEDGRLELISGDMVVQSESWEMKETSYEYTI